MKMNIKKKDFFDQQLIDLQGTVGQYLKCGLPLTKISQKMQILLKETKIPEGETRYSFTIKEQWRRMYEKIGIDVDFSSLPVIKEHLGYWPIFMSKDVTMELLDRCIRKHLFPISHDITYDTIIPWVKVKSDRTTERKTYVVWTLADELPEKFKAAELDIFLKRKRLGITAEERMALGAWYFVNKKRKLLDKKCWTICLGSLFKADGKTMPAMHHTYVSSDTMGLSGTTAKEIRKDGHFATRRIELFTQ